MGSSRKPSLELDHLWLCPTSPGPLGVNDAADPDQHFRLLGDTPGPVGWNDHACPDTTRSFLGTGELHFSVSLDTDLLIWDYDPQRLLDDSSLSPDFVEAAHRAMACAVQMHLRPEVHEAYRTPAESARKHQLWKQGKGGRASDAWRSCHNYGLAMDVWLYDRHHRYIDNHVKGWYKLYKHLAAACKDEGLFWGEGFGSGDADHFEYHPKWSEGANGTFLLKVKSWAEAAAMWLPNAPKMPDGVMGPPPEPDASLWMPFVWWAAGAGGSAPPAEFLAHNPPPVQSAKKKHSGKKP